MRKLLFVMLKVSLLLTNPPESVPLNQHFSNGRACEALGLVSRGSQSCSSTPPQQLHQLSWTAQPKAAYSTQLQAIYYSYMWSDTCIINLYPKLKYIWKPYSPGTSQADREPAVTSPRREVMKGSFHTTYPAGRCCCIEYLRLLMKL